MEDSTQFTHVPLIGYNNIPRVLDNDESVTRKLLINASAGPTGRYIPINAVGDEGGGAIASYTSKSPDGRYIGGAGNMLTTIEVIGEGENADDELPAFLLATAVPAGLAGLMDNRYSLSTQPPAESFDYSQWLPRVNAHGCLSFYGGGIPAGSSGAGSLPWAPTDRFPSLPSVPPFDHPVLCGVFLYMPPGFYDDINAILNEAFGFTGADEMDITLVDQPPYGLLFTRTNFGADPIGSGQLEVDFSWSGAN